MLKHCTQCGEAQPGDARFCPRCGTPIVAGVDDPLLGKVVAERYLLVEKIGQGGSGTIYRAEHTTLRKKVAVKILHAQLSQDDTALERFRREATTVSELDNDHILQVLDFGRAEDKRLFFAMEYLDGETLSKVVEREKQLAVPRVVDVLTQTAEALMEAHGLGYIHRDLRPRNVFLITRRGRPDFVKLLDFGLAKLVLPDAEVKQTAMGMTFGDPRYMSPEQAKGDTLDRRADIYSLGAIAFETLTGAPPFTGSGTFEVLQQHLDAPVPKVRDLRADCPEWLDQVVQRALAKKPDDRFSTVVKLLECLREQKAPPVLEPSKPAPQLKPEPAAAKVEPAQPAKSETAAAAKSEPAAAKSEPSSKLAAASIAKSIASAPSAKDTQALGTVRTPFSAGGKGKNREKDKKGGRDAGRSPSAAGSASTSGEMTAVPHAGPEPLAVPTVVVETTGKTAEQAAAGAPAPAGETPTNGHASDAAVLTDEKPAPRITPAAMAALGLGSETRPKGEATGEWFEAGIERAAGAAHYDEHDYEIPKRNKGPLIIFGVAGGLTLVGLLVILLLPKPEHKPLKTTEPDKLEAKVAPPAPPPAAVAAAPTPAPAPAAAPAVAAPEPAPAVKPEEKAAAPVVVAAPKPPEKVAKIVEKAPPPVEKPAAVEEPPASKKVESASARQPREAKEAKPSKSGDKPAKVASASDGKRRRDGVPEGFRDPFADTAAAPKPAASPSEAGQSEFFVKLGRQKLGSGDLAAAAANFNKAREYDPRSPDALAGLGEVAFEQGDYNGAAVHLKQALKLSPNRPRYLVLLGQAYYKLGRAKDAVGEYRKALKLDPGNSEAQRSLEIAERKLAQGG